MCEDVLQVLGAVALVLLGAGLAALWDTYKARRDRAARQRAALTGFREEMASNYKAAENNLNLIAHEQREIEKDGGPLLNPINLLEVGAWAIARLDLPKPLLEDQGLLSKLRIINTNTAHINGIIASREAFRIQHLSDEAGLLQGLEGYAGILLHLQRDLKERIEEADPWLEGYVPAG